MHANDEIKTFFNQLAPNWDNHAEEYEKREQVVRMAGIPKDSRIADIGCGQGVMFPHLLNTQPQWILAIDLSEEMIRYAKKHSTDERIRFLNADLLASDIPTVDAAVIYNAYPHFTDKPALVKKLAQTVCPQGIVVIAHGAGKGHINGIHRGEHVSRISVPLREATVEAKQFEPYFHAEVVVDEEEIYFLLLRRTDEAV